jgi:hypothetical protein
LLNLFMERKYLKIDFIVFSIFTESANPPISFFEEVINYN